VVDANGAFSNICRSAINHFEVLTPRSANKYLADERL